MKETILNYLSYFNSNLIFDYFINNYDEGNMVDYIENNYNKDHALLIYLALGIIFRKDTFDNLSDQDYDAFLTHYFPKNLVKLNNFDDKKVLITSIRNAFAHCSFEYDDKSKMVYVPQKEGKKEKYQIPLEDLLSLIIAFNKEIDNYQSSKTFIAKSFCSDDPINDLVTTNEAYNQLEKMYQISLTLTRKDGKNLTDDDKNCLLIAKDQANFRAKSMIDINTFYRQFKSDYKYLYGLKLDIMSLFSIKEEQKQDIIDSYQQYLNFITNSDASPKSNMQMLLCCASNVLYYDNSIMSFNLACIEAIDYIMRTNISDIKRGIYGYLPTKLEREEYSNAAKDLNEVFKIRQLSSLANFYATFMIPYTFMIKDFRYDLLDLSMFHPKINEKIIFYKEYQECGSLTNALQDFISKYNSYELNNKKRLAEIDKLNKSPEEKAQIKMRIESDFSKSPKLKKFIDTYKYLKEICCDFKQINNNKSTITHIRNAFAHGFININISSILPEKSQVIFEDYDRNGKKVFELATNFQEFAKLFNDSNMQVIKSYLESEDNIKIKYMADASVNVKNK